MKFDGKKYAEELESQLRARVAKLPRVPRAVSFVVGDDVASIKYSELKRAAAKRVGIEFEVCKLSNADELAKELEQAGKDQLVDGVMVQLPVPGLQGQRLREVLAAIPLAKDMDGLRWEESGVTPATVKAILNILDKIAQAQISNSQILKLEKHVVVGAKGSVGRPLVVKLKELGKEVIELDLGDDLDRVREGGVVISCTGQAGLIKPEMVAEGAVLVDVGSPKPEMTPEVYAKASVYVPSPGGVGPVTIVSLLKNTVELFGNETGLENVGRIAEK